MNEESSFPLITPILRPVRRLRAQNYKGPFPTYQQTLQTQEMMEQKLENYERVENIEEVKLYSHVRYVTLDKDGKQAFRLGGMLIRIQPEYVMLSNGSFVWSVQRYHYPKDEQGQPDVSQEPIFETIQREEINYLQTHAFI